MPFFRFQVNLYKPGLQPLPFSPRPAQNVVEAQESAVQDDLADGGAQLQLGHGLRRRRGPEGVQVESAAAGEHALGPIAAPQPGGPGAAESRVNVLRRVRGADHRPEPDHFEQQEDDGGRAEAALQSIVAQ